MSIERDDNQTMVCSISEFGFYINQSQQWILEGWNGSLSSAGAAIDTQDRINVALNSCSLFTPLGLISSS
jgi:hypothetical protein